VVAHTLGKQFRCAEALAARLVVSDDFATVAFLSLTGLDLSLWFLAKGFFDALPLF
jgi:hypothetical protein